MRYLKHAEIVRTYGVSDKTIRNWIEGAQHSKNTLDVILVKGRPYLADTIHNEEAIAELIDNNKKYRNTKSSLRIHPTDKFYENFNSAEVTRIINSLAVKKQVPYRTRYVGVLSKLWGDYLSRLSNTKIHTYISGSISYMSILERYLSEDSRKSQVWNIVDLNCANALSSVDFVANLSRRNLLSKYIAADISPSLTKLAAKTLLSKKENKGKISEAIFDIELESIERMLSLNPILASKIPNHFLLLGGTITNYESAMTVIQHISSSMKSSDLLSITLKLDSTKNRSFFDFNTEHVLSELSSHDESFLEMLGFQQKDYDVFQEYDKTSKSRYIYIEPSKNIEIVFADDNKSSVNLRSKERLTLLKIRHWDDTEFTQVLRDAGLTVIHSSLLQDESFMGITCKKL